MMKASVLIISILSVLAGCKSGLRTIPSLGVIGPTEKPRPAMSEIESRIEGSWQLMSEPETADTIGGLPERLRFTVREDAGREVEYCGFGMKGRAGFIVENDLHLKFQTYVPVDGLGPLPRYISVKILAADKRGLKLEQSGLVFEYKRIRKSELCKQDDQEMAAAL